MSKSKRNQKPSKHTLRNTRGRFVSAEELRAIQRLQELASEERKEQRRRKILGYSTKPTKGEQRTEIAWGFVESGVIPKPDQTKAYKDKYQVYTIYESKWKYEGLTGELLSFRTVALLNQLTEEDTTLRTRVVVKLQTKRGKVLATVSTKANYPGATLDDLNKLFAAKASAQRLADEASEDEDTVVKWEVITLSNNPTFGKPRSPRKNTAIKRGGKASGRKVKRKATKTNKRQPKPRRNNQKQKRKTSVRNLSKTTKHTTRIPKRKK